MPAAAADIAANSRVSGVRSQPSAANEARLMERVQAGSVDAFEELYDHYGDRAYRVAWSICRDAGRAEDAVQEAFLSVWRSRAKYRSQHGTVAAWLLSVVRHRAIDAQRQNDRHASQRAGDEQLDDRPAGDDVAHQVVERAEVHRLYTLLARLPGAQQEVITLAFYGQLTHTEIGKQLGLPPGTVKGRMRLGLHKLRNDLSPRPDLPT